MRGLSPAEASVFRCIESMDLLSFEHGVLPGPVMFFCSMQRFFTILCTGGPCLEA